MMKKDEKILNREGESFVITHNLRGEKIEDWVQQFQENEKHRQYNHKKKNYLTHEIISFHKEDVKNISLEKMENMAREYINLRNPKGMYVAVPHFDKSHYHIHLAVSAIEYKSGKSLRMSKQQFQELKKDIQKYQQIHFPELSKSVVQHGKNGINISDKEYQMKLRTGRMTDREKVIAIMQDCYAKAISKKDFLFKVQESGLKTYERSKKTTGVLLGKHKFRFSRLGFAEEKLAELNKSLNRGKELGIVRGKSKEKNINRNR